MIGHQEVSQGAFGLHCALSVAEKRIGSVGTKLKSDHFVPKLALAVNRGRSLPHVSLSDGISGPGGNWCLSRGNPNPSAESDFIRSLWASSITLQGALGAGSN